MGDSDQVSRLMPVVGELSDEVWAAIAEGQPVLLTHGGHPAAVLLDVDSYAEVEASLDEVAERVTAA